MRIKVLLVLFLFIEPVYSGVKFTKASSQKISCTLPTTSLTNVTIMCRVYVQVPTNGCFLKIGSNNGGASIGIGASDMDVAGTRLLGLSPGISWLNTGADLTTGWHHVAMLVTGSGGVPKFYLNGVDLGFASAINFTAPTGTFEIGSNTGDNDESRYLEGIVDDVRFYNRQLSSQEMASIALSRSRIAITDGLIGWWKLDEGDDGATATGTNIVKDYSGQGNHGSPVNDPQWRASEWINYP